MAKTVDEEIIEIVTSIDDLIQKSSGMPLEEKEKRMFKFILEQIKDISKRLKDLEVKVG